MITKSINVTDLCEVRFHNNVDFCIGTGRLGLALTKEYLDQLKLVQEEIGFSFIRGHGLLSDDISIYHEYEEDGKTYVEYNYTYLDRIFDAFLELNIRPFIELGFMPGELASGSQTIFYWNGNVTPPKDYDKWCDLIKALLTHLMDRYGEAEVLSWPIEVWNEPNLRGFWKDADKAEYFKLFDRTIKAIKSVDDRFQVGGPAVCGGSDEEWIQAFLDYCHENNVKPDFITRHHYTVEFPDVDGHYAYSALMKPEDGFNNLMTTRTITDSFDEFKGLPIHITEFNTSYTPQGVLHDTNLNAALIAQQLSRLGDVNESYSYWTFGDVFEEKGVPFTPFHGGFGLLANGSIRKPTYFTFLFFKELKKKLTNCLCKNDYAVIGKTKNGYAGVLWNTGLEDMTLNIELPLEGAQASFLIKTVDEDTCNPLKIWHELGEPANPDKETVALLREAAKPAISTNLVDIKDGKTTASFLIKKSGVIYFEAKSYECKSDRGYSYERAITTR